MKNQVSLTRAWRQPTKGGKKREARCLVGKPVARGRTEEVPPQENCFLQHAKAEKDDLKGKVRRGCFRLISFNFSARGHYDVIRTSLRASAGHTLHSAQLWERSGWRLAALGCLSLPGYSSELKGVSSLGKRTSIIRS